MVARRNRRQYKVKLYVEGGGDHNPSLAQDVRLGFKKFLDKAGIVNKPRVVACGSRWSAYESYRIANASAKDTKKKEYDMGRDSFAILSQIDPQKICARSKWAKRFCILLKEKTDSIR